MSNMKLDLGFIVFLIIALYASASLGAHDLSQDYRFFAKLDQDGMYELFWSFDLDAETISFAVRVKTTGWVGFGLSPNGQMPGSDVVIGWVDSEGEKFFHVSTCIVHAINVGIFAGIIFRDVHLRAYAYMNIRGFYFQFYSVCKVTVKLRLILQHNSSYRKCAIFLSMLLRINACSFATMSH